MDVDALMVDDGPPIYYDGAFRNVLEDHMTFLRTHPLTQVLVVDPAQAYRFEGDLFGLLSRYNLPPHFHWVTMRMNKMSTPTEASASLSSLLIPDHTTVEHIRQSHMTRRRIT